MDLICDVLDNQLVDRNGRRIGKVDGIVAELREGQPPLLKYLETGLVVNARRFHPGLAKWLSRWSRPSRIPWAAITGIGISVNVGLEGDSTTLLDTEHRARKIVCRMPGH